MSEIIGTWIFVITISYTMGMLTVVWMLERTDAKLKRENKE